MCLFSFKKDVTTQPLIEPKVLFNLNAGRYSEVYCFADSECLSSGRDSRFACQNVPA